MFAGAEDVADGTALLTGHLAHQAVHEHFEKLMMALSGVLSSWGLHVAQEIGLYAPCVLELERNLPTYQCAGTTNSFLRRCDACHRDSRVSVGGCSPVMRLETRTLYSLQLAA
jgi:hypothetical protein